MPDPALLLLIEDRLSSLGTDPGAGAFGDGAPGQPPRLNRQQSPKRASVPSAAPFKITEGTSRRGPQIGSGKRAVEALAVITKKPGLTASKIAARTSVSKRQLIRPHHRLRGS